MDDVKFMLFVVAIVCILMGVLGLVIRAAVRGSTRAPDSEDDSGPGTYELQGVRKSDAHDVSVRIDAASIENARVKAAMQGIHVTRVRFLGRAMPATTPGNRKQEELARANEPAVRAKDMTYRE